MKLSIKQKDLLPGLQAVSRSLGVRSTLPVLSCVLLQIEKGSLKLSTTNLEVGVVKLIGSKVTQEGEACVPAKTLLEAVSSLPETDIAIETDSGSLKLSSLNFKASLNSFPPSEFPSIPLAGEGKLKISAGILKKALPEITYASAVDEGRPVLTGVLFEVKDKALELVATDGFRLAHKKVSLEGEEALRVIIPRRTLEEVFRLIDEELSGDLEAKIEISTSENQNQIVFKIGKTFVSSRLIEGQFPAWEKIVPKEFKLRVVLDKGDLMKALKLSSIFAKDSANITKISVKQNKLLLSSETKELGNQETEIGSQTEGEDMEVAFNSRFLIESLSSITTTQVSIEFSGNLSACLLRPLGEEGTEHIVMPVRVS